MQGIEGQRMRALQFGDTAKTQSRDETEQIIRFPSQGSGQVAQSAANRPRAVRATR